MLTRAKTSQVITVHASPESVWGVLNDPSSTSALLPKGSRVEMLSDGMATVGSRWRVVTEVGKRRFVTLSEVVDAVPHRLHVVRSESELGVSTTRMELTGGGDRTQMTLHGTMDWRGGWGTLSTRLISAFAAGPLARRSLRQLKRHIEAETAGSAE
jgi:carbon monoxide dehydrogenase subunit G